MKLNFIAKTEIDSVVKRRKGELKIGESLSYATESIWENLEESETDYVILGIEEDFGPRANLGNGGTNRAWKSFLSGFLNIQNNSFLEAEKILVLGSIRTEFDEEKNLSIIELREKVVQLDDFIYPIIQKIVSASKIPIVIGGGHNNSYPLIKGSSLALNQAINCINCDPHADFRALEGRHSGNGFSYAKSENFLNQYSIIALHENYNSSSMLHEMKTEDVVYHTYEDIFIREKIAFTDAIRKGLRGISDDPFGVELDMDAIENFPSSAKTPSGISAREARQYLSICGSSFKAIYLHLPEAAPIEEKDSSSQAGKLLSYLVSDFVKANQ